MLDSCGIRCVETVGYCDGLGRPVLIVTNGLSADGLYSCAATSYDLMGREGTVLLPGGGLQSSDWVDFQAALDLSKASHGNDPCPFTNNTYDGIGQVSSLAYAGSLGSLSYGYNVRGWLTDIQGGMFSEHVWYNNGPGAHAFNGQVSAAWSSIGQNGVPNGYKYYYDSLGRMTDAVYGESTSLSSGTGRYSEHSITYNANGAVTGLKRNGRLDNGSWGLVDDLAFTLDGDRLLTVEDAATELSYENAFDFHGGGDDEYSFDGNGRLTYDPNKGVEVSYDLTGVPSTVIIGDVLNSYTYSADGVKQRVYSHFYGHMAPLALDAVPMGRGPLDGGGLIGPGTGNDFSVFRDTRYCGPFVLESDTLSKALFPGGFCTMSGGQPTFHYYVRNPGVTTAAWSQIRASLSRRPSIILLAASAAT